MHSFSFSRVFGAHLDPIPPKGSLESAQTSTTFEWRRAAIGQEGTMVERRKPWQSLATIFDRLVSEPPFFFYRGLSSSKRNFTIFQNGCNDFQGKCIFVKTLKNPVTPPEVRYLDPQKITIQVYRSPQYDWMFLGIVMRIATVGKTYKKGAFFEFHLIAESTQKLLPKQKGSLQILAAFATRIWTDGCLVLRRSPFRLRHC